MPPAATRWETLDASQCVRRRHPILLRLGSDIIVPDDTQQKSDLTAGGFWSTSGNAVRHRKKVGMYVVRGGADGFSRPTCKMGFALVWEVQCERSEVLGLTAAVSSQRSLMEVGGGGGVRTKTTATTIDGIPQFSMPLSASAFGWWAGWMIDTLSVATLVRPGTHAHCMARYGIRLHILSGQEPHSRSPRNTTSRYPPQTLLEKDEAISDCCELQGPTLHWMLANWPSLGPAASSIEISAAVGCRRLPWMRIKADQPRESRFAMLFSQCLPCLAHVENNPSSMSLSICRMTINQEESAAWECAEMAARCF